MDSPGQIEGGLSQRNYIIRFQKVSYDQTNVFDTPQNNKSAPGLYFVTISTRIDLKKPN